MGRIRSIKPEFCSSEEIAGLSIGCRLHFVMLWTYADDAGRGVDNPRLIKAALWPLDDEITAAQVENWQVELADAGRVIRYTADGRSLFQVVNFGEHQHPNRPQTSKHPEPPPTTHEPRSEHTVNAHPVRVAVLEGLGEVEVEVEGDGEVEELALKKRVRKRDELFEAVAEVCQWHLPSLTKTARGQLNKSVADLRAVGATPQQIQERAGNYRLKYAGCDLSPSALAKHWPGIATPPPAQLGASMTAIARNRARRTTA
jgi:hypothetical protein